MKARSLGFIIISLMGILFFITSATYSLYTGKDIAAQTEPEFSPTRLIVKLSKEADKKVTLGEVQGNVITGLAQLDSLNLKFKVTKQEKLFKEFKETALKLDKFSSVYILEVPEGTDLKKMKREYESLPEVDYVELDHKLELFEEPNDSLFSHQWYLNNTGQGYLGVNRVPGDSNDTQVIKYGTEDADIDALEAFERDDETTIPLVGIIDTGVDLDHEDLADNVWTNPGEIPDNGVDDDHNGFVDDFYGWDFSGDTSAAEPVEDNDPTDYFGHGTHCAGIVGAVRDNGIGVAGIISPCKIMAIKSFPFAHSSVSARSIIYAADMGCDLINMSWGSPYPSNLIEDALDYAVYRGVLPIAAAGNSGGEDYFYPASLPQVFTVGASNSDDEVTYFSTYGNHVEVVAPGEDILSLRADSTDMYATGPPGWREPFVHIVNEAYYLADGTSMASPCVVGVAAYILAASPGISNERVREIIEQSADDILYPYGGDTLYSPGKDIYSGYGRVNLNSALQHISGCLAKIEYPFENAIVSGDVAIMGTASGDSFENYVLEYGDGLSPEEWTEITSSDLPVSNDTLGIWNSAGLVGLCTIRLTVGDQNQDVVHVVADNGIHVEITSPNDGDTLFTGYAQVYGYTVVPDFSHYTLEYGFGESPPIWIPIATSTRMVADDILGNWAVSFPEETNYALRLTAETKSGEIYADTVVVFVKSIVCGGWVQELSGFGSLSPAVGDIDGDGYDEIVVGVGGDAGGIHVGGIEVFSHEGEGELGWPKDTDKNMMSSPALGDLDRDGIDDIVICSEQVGVHAYLSGSNDWVGYAWTSGSEAPSLASPVIADLENDGYLEVLTVNDSGTVYAWRNDGQSVIPGNNGVLAHTDLGGGPRGFPSLAVADLDKDGENEVIVGSSRYHQGLHGGLYIFDIEGHRLLGPNDYPEVFSHIAGIAIANIDEEEDLEIIVFGADQGYFSLFAFKKDGTQVTNYPIILEDLEVGSWFSNHPAVGDLEGDGILEIVVTVWTLGEARIYAWHQDGTPLGSGGSGGLLVSMKSPDGERKRQVLSTLGNNMEEIVAKITSTSKEELAGLISTFDEDPVFASVPETFGSPVLADVNGDGNVDIIARAGYFTDTGYERVFAWDYEGNLIPGWPLYASNEPSSITHTPYIPTLTDMDKDGKLDMVVGTPYNISIIPKVVAWEFNTYYDYATMHWPKYMHDKWNSGRYGFSPPEGEIPNIPPPNFHVESWTDSSVSLAWNPRAPWLSIGYNIYRSTVSGEPGEKINDDLIPQADAQYQDLELAFGQIYYYTITNFDTNYQESDPSYEVEVAPGQPTAPTGLIAQLVGYIVALHWNQNPIEEDVTKYRVYRKDPDHTDYQLLDSVMVLTNYVDHSDKSMGIYCYRVTAVNSFGIESLPSESVGVDLSGLFDRTDYYVGGSPSSVFCADLDNDNDLDLAVANAINNYVCILKNDGNGGFQYGGYYGVGDNSRSVFCADLDNDSDLDLAVANVLSDNVSILTNDGNGVFPDRVDYDVGDGPISIFCADLDDDTDLDLAVANITSDNISILTNDGNGVFPDRVDYDGGGGPISIFCADLDNDNDLDLAVANCISDKVSILTNDGNGVFPDRVDYDAADNPRSIFCADLDNDNDLDLAVANHGSDNVSILTNDGNGVFPDRVDYDVGDGPSSIFCADLDNVNGLDLALANDYGHNVSILTNDGYGGFPDRLDCGVGYHPSSVFCADLDNDNDLDLAVANGPSRTVSILLNILLSIDYMPGDVNMDDIVDLGDVNFLIDYLFRFGFPPFIMDAADVNCDSVVDIADVVYLINYLFMGGPPPCSPESEFLAKAHSAAAELIVYDTDPHKTLKTVSIEAEFGVDVSGLQLEVEWDKHKLELSDILQTARTRKLGLYHNKGKEGELKIGMVDVSGKEVIRAGEGPLLKLNMKSRNSSLDLSSFEIKRAILVDRQGRKLAVNVINKLDQSILPEEFSLSQNYPNPFNPQTVIQYALPHDCEVRVTIYNILGQKVTTLVNEHQQAGYKRIVWDSKNDRGKEVASGVYFYKMQAGKFTQSKKMVILK